MNDAGTITTAIRRFVVENYMFGRDLTMADSDSLLDNGIIDSTGVLELVAHLEETYGISVADHELIPDNLDSIANITAYVSRKTMAGGTIPTDILSPVLVTEVAQ
jgi:acyl carrier protein